MNRRNRFARGSQRQPANVDFAAYRKTDIRFWKSRLIQRKYTHLARIIPGHEYSAKIEHNGLGYFFPLGSDDENRAATKALEIYSNVVRRGWEAARQRFAREITVAIFWGLSPVACTYTTMFTLVRGSIPGRRPRRKPVVPCQTVAVIEAEEEVKNALVFWIDRQPGFRCIRTFTNVNDALHSLQRVAPAMVLINRNLADLAGGQRLDTLKSLRPNLPVFSFGVYEESDWIFHSITGVNAGYYLRRRPPLDWFDPIVEAARESNFTPQNLARHIRKYFQGLFEVSRPADDAQEMANLTRREREILVCLSKGYTDKEIADALKISVWTVHGHVKNVFDKLGVHSRTEAVVKYLQK